MSLQFDIDQFERRGDLVAQLVRAEDAFSIMRRRIELPSSCVALAWGESGQPRLAPPGGFVQSDGARELLFVRTSPIELQYHVGGLRSEDGYDFSASVAMSVRIVPERSELESLRRTAMGSANRIDLDRLHRFCEETVRSALSEFASSRSAADLASASTWGAFDAVLDARFKPVGFASGLALGPDPRVTFSSPVYAEARRTEATASLRRQRLEADAALRSAAVEVKKSHLSQLEDVLAKARELADRNDGVGLAALIKTFDPSQRGDLYQAVAAPGADARRTEAVLIVAGDELLWLDPAALDKAVRRQDLSSSIGPLRSVRVRCDGDRRTILVGAARGVHVVDADGGPHDTYPYENGATVRGGFNAAAIAGDRLFATHSEIGLVAWRIGRPDDQETCLIDLTDGARAVRDVQLDGDGRLWFSVDRRVVGWDPDTDEPPTVADVSGEVTALSVGDGYMAAGLADGRVLRWPAFDFDAAEQVRPPGRSRIRSVACMAGGGIPRLLVADGSPHLDLQVVGDAYRGEYRAGTAVRWGFAADDIIVGVDDNRDRLLTWSINTPHEPAATVSIGRLCGHTIQDVALLAARRST